MFYRVGDVESFPEGRPVPVSVAGRSLVVVKWRDDFFALRNRCPHQSQALTPARVHGSICGTGKIGEIGLAVEEPVIVCPWHTWEFRLRDGECARDPSKRVKSYATEVRSDCVYVDVEADGPSSGERETAAASA